MTTMKDKLSASVRQAKAAQQPEATVEVAKPAAAAAKPAAPAAKPAAKKPAAPKPAAPKAAAPKAAAKPAASKAATQADARVHAGGIPDSNGTLHPQRVWPD